jgi:hypothetical protein
VNNRPGLTPLVAFGKQQAGPYKSITTASLLSRRYLTAKKGNGIRTEGLYGFAAGTLVPDRCGGGERLSLGKVVTGF